MYYIWAHGEDWSDTLSSTRYSQDAYVLLYGQVCQITHRINMSVTQVTCGKHSTTWVLGVVLVSSHASEGCTWQFCSLNLKCLHFSILSYFLFSELGFRLGFRVWFEVLAEFLHELPKKIMNIHEHPSEPC